MFQHHVSTVKNLINMCLIGFEVFNSIQIVNNISSIK